MEDNRTDEAIQARLGKPGAGIPWLERRIGKTGLALYCAIRDREQALTDFKSGAAEVIAGVKGLDESAGRTRVLVPRLRGMEDSSRYWSPYMIVRHLCIVDRQVLIMIKLLSPAAPRSGR